MRSNGNIVAKEPEGKKKKKKKKLSLKDAVFEATACDAKGRIES
jgi:hypothetical protein